ncbi:B12-binding domain-containing radical SAM protein, partial [Candidatus Zixiibacteriota bacterium]
LMDPTETRRGDGPQILLVNLWIYDFAAYNLWTRPLGLLYIAAVLRENGYRVNLLDCLDVQNGDPVPGGARNRFGCGKFPKTVLPKPAAYREIPRRYGRYGIPEKNFLDVLSNLAPVAAILVTSGMTYWYPGVFRAIELLRAHLPDTPVLLGGIYATLCASHARERSGADLVIGGPGEAAALQAVDLICGLRSDLPDIENLDELPFPAFDLYGRSGYACLLTSRGCPRACTYCASR